MFGSVILDVVIGIVFIYVILSMMCSAIREAIEAWLRTRAAYLERGIRELLGEAQNGNLTRNLYRHPVIFPLFFGDYPSSRLSTTPRWYSRGHNLPSYIPARNFALALLDLAAKGAANAASVSVDTALGDDGLSLEAIRSNIAKLPNASLQCVVAMAVSSAGNDLEQAMRNVEAWYDSAMDRITGMYKRSSQLVIFLLGLVLAIGFNINTLALADYLYRNPSQRQALVAEAEGMAKNSVGTTQDYASISSELGGMSLPIGWSETGNSFATSKGSGATKIWNDYLAVVLGWVLTAFAVTLGAPFWFDVLNKIMTFRTSIKPFAPSVPTLVSSGSPPLPAGMSQPAVVAPVTAAATGMAGEELDGCGGTLVLQTLDEELPSAHGGVAQ